MDKQKYITKAIDWAKKRGYSAIKANHEEFETPTQFTKPNEDQPYIPDVTGRKRNKKIYIEVATKTEDTRRRITKWKLLSTLASMKGGKFFLLAPHGHKAFTQRLMDKYNLNAQLVYIK